MSGKIYLNLILLFGILAQEILGNLTHENIKVPSDILTRQKRVISRIPDEDLRVPIHQVPYIVHIKYNNRIRCTGSILSRHVAITIPACVYYTVTEYIVVSSSARTSRGNQHNITDVKTKVGDHPNRSGDGIALLTVNPNFEIGIYAQPIELHTGPLLTGMIGTISGWGFSFRNEDRGTNYGRDLRSIQVPILAHRDCVNRYHPLIQISDKDICTYHPQKQCGHTDRGAPLVVDGHLAGVHLWSGPNTCQTTPEYPDVFVVLQDVAYSQWIRSNVHNIEARF